jgi:1-acyl-sn-glycerol-3-phosphate acyltransferase
VIGLLGESTPTDCEARDAWGFSQDVNTWTSWAYVAAAVSMWWIVARGAMPRPTRVAMALYAGFVALEGVGSVLFHGAPLRPGHLVHDAALIGMLGFIAGWQWALAARRSDRAPVAAAAVGLGSAIAVGAVWWATSEVTNIAVGVLVAAVVVAEITARRRGAGGIWSTPLVALTAVALLTWYLGSAGSPVCEPTSSVQPHGAWHLMSAVVAVAWFDRALEVSGPSAAPRLFRRLADRAIGILAVVLVMVFHRSVDVMDRPTRSARRRTSPPTLLVANHGNGFVDPVVVAASLRRLPRFMAKAALWKVVVARPFLGLAGALPVYRTADGDASGDNRSVFAACHEELARRATVAIFPEGTTGDRASLDRVKSGAARIALGALPEAPDVVVVPVGLAFESMVVTRPRAVVVYGEPIEVAGYLTAPIGADGEAHADDVHRLTEQITSSLAAVSPQFASVDERDTFRAAARVTLATSSTTTWGSPAAFGDVERLARSVAGSDDVRRRSVMDAFARFARQLTLLDLREQDLEARSIPIGRLALSAMAIALFGTFLASVALLFAPAALVTIGATAVVRSTATKGTVRLLVGFASGLLTVVIVGVVLADGWAAVGVALSLVGAGAVALFVVAPLTRAASSVGSRLRVRSRGSAIDRVLADRAELVRLVHDASMAPADGSDRERGPSVG